MILPFLRSSRLTNQKESAVTKEQFDNLVKSLDGLGLRTNDRDVVHKLQSSQSDALLVSVVLAPLYLPPHSILCSALESINEKLRGVSDRVEEAGHLGRDDGKAVFELLVEIRAAVNGCQVSSEAGSAV